MRLRYMVPVTRNATLSRVDREFTSVPDLQLDVTQNDPQTSPSNLSLFLPPYPSAARHGMAPRPLRRLGVAALLLRGAGDTEAAGKRRYGLCSNAAAAAASFAPRKLSLRERKMREGKGEGKPTGNGGREKRAGGRVEGRRKREPVRVLRPRQLSLQVRGTATLQPYVRTRLYLAGLT